MDKDQKNAFALLGGLAAAMLAAKKLTEPEGSFSKAGKPVELKLTGSEINLKDPKGTVDRYINKLNIPSEQIAIRQKQLRNLPTDEKGRVSRDDVYDVFSSDINYRVVALSEPLDAVLISSKSSLYKAMKKLSSSIQPKYKSWFEGQFHSLVSQYNIASGKITESLEYEMSMAKYNYHNIYEAVIDNALHKNILPNNLGVIARWSYPNMRKGEIYQLLTTYRNIIASLFKIDLYEEVETKERIPKITDDPGATVEDIEYHNENYAFEAEFQDKNNEYKVERHLQKIKKQKLEKWFEHYAHLIHLGSIFGEHKNELSEYFGVKTIKGLRNLYKILLNLYDAAPEYYNYKSDFIKDLIKLSKKRAEICSKSKIKKNIDIVLPGIQISGTKGSNDSTKYGAFGVGSVLDIKKSFNSDAKKAYEVECLLYAKLNEILKNPLVASELEGKLAEHFSLELHILPIFWFRGLVVGDTLYVQELQSDHASNIRKHNSNKWKRQGRETKSTKFKWDLEKAEAMSYKNITVQSIMQQYEHMDEDDANEDFEMELSFKRESLIYEQGMSPEEADQIVEQMKINGIKKYDIPKTHVPPTDWLRSDIIMAFAFAACLGLKKVAFCSAAASIATVGGKVTGQRKFYNTIVPEKVRSVAKKYNIKQLQDKNLFFTKSGLSAYNVKLREQEEPRARDSSDLYATVWSLDSAYEFFREKGYPIFG